MADYTLNTSNNTQCGGNELSNSLYSAVYIKLISQNATAGTSVVQVQIALWASYASGASTRQWSGTFVVYKGTSGSAELIRDNYYPPSGGWTNYTSPVWVVNKQYTVSHTGSGNTWQAIYSFGVNVQTNTDNNGSVTHGHRNFTPNGGTNWYTNAIIPAMTKNYYFDVNGWLDGTSSGNTSGMGTFDVTVGGTLRSNDTTDFYAAYPAGSSYSVSDIKAATGKAYIGVVGGAISGTIASGSNVRLGFFTQTVWIYVNGWHRAIPWVYVNGWHRAWARVYNGGWRNCKT